MNLAMHSFGPEALESARVLEASGSPTPERVDLDRLLDEHPATPLHLLITLLGFAVLLVDGYDLFVTSQLLPPIASSFHVHTAALTSSYAVQLVGSALGTFVIGPIADRLGRRPALLTSLGLFGLATLASVGCSNTTTFNVTRFMAGFLGGGLMPIAVSLVADVVPRRWRGALIGAVYGGLTIGPLGSALATGQLLGVFGWRSAYWIGGLMPLMLWPFAFAFVAESPRLLARRNPADPRIRRALRGLGVRSIGKVFLTEPARHANPVVGLFRGGRGVLTLALWLASVLSLMAVTLYTLLGAFYHEFDGIPLAHFAGYLTLALIGSAAAVFGVGPVMDRIGAYRSLFVLALGGAIDVVALAGLKVGTPAFDLTIFLGGFAVAGAQQSLNILTPVLYPAAMRAAAVGWKGGLSRLASAAAPALGGMIMARRAGLPVALTVTAVPLVLLALGTPLLAQIARRTAERTAEPDAGAT